MIRTILLPLLVLTACLLPAVPGRALDSGGGSPALERVRLQLKWRHQFQFAGYYAAEARGFYREAGLQVEFLEGGPDMNSPEAVVAGQAEYGVEAPNLLLERYKGKPVVALAAVFQHSPEALMTMPGSLLLTPKDLRGRKVTVLFKKLPTVAAMLLQEGVSPDMLETVPGRVGEEALVDGEVDALPGYITTELFKLNQLGVHPILIQPWAYGLDFYGDCLFTTEDEIASRPERVEAFLRASLHGWRYAMAHPEEIIDLILTRYDTAASREQLRYEARTMNQLIMPDLIQVGHMNPERWRHIADTFSRLGSLPEGFPLGGFLYAPQGKPFPWIRWSLAVGAVLLGLGGIALALFVFNRRLTREIEEREKAQKALRINEERQRLVLTASSEGVWDHNLATGENYLNPAWKEMLGYAAEEIEPDRKWFLAMVHPEDRRLIESVVEEVTAGKRDQYRLEFRMRHRDGGWIWIIRHGMVVERDAAGAPVRILGTHRDVSERKRAEEELINAKAQAEAANRAKSDFLAAMSHEIRTPMNAVLGMTELALESELTEKQRDWLETVKESGEHLLGIIDNILDFSKIEARRLEIDHADFDLHETIRSVERSMRVEAQRKNLSLETKIAENVPRHVAGDPGRLRQVLVNLVDNAVKFTEHGGVTITAGLADPPISKTGPTVRVCIKDTGIGIPPAKQQAVFESFSQADGSITRRYGGTGLGLAITKQLVEMMGGEIGLRSAPGKGSEFSFTLTFEPGDPERIKIRTAREGNAATQNRLQLKVLLAEDNPANIKVATAFLNRLGHKSVHASNGEEVISLLRRETFDLVLMDVEMPGMDGMEATRRIRRGEAGEEKKDVPIIAMTAHAVAGTKEQLLAAGMDDYLSKPVDFHLLAALMGENAAPEGGALLVPGAVLPAPPVWDREGALDRFGEDEALLRAVCADFLQETPDNLEELRRAAEQADLGRVHFLGHTLKANCGTVGASAMERAATALEQAAEAEKIHDVKALLPVLEEEFKKARRVLSESAPD